MTEEQKQALIEYCKLRIKVLQTYWHVNAEDMSLAKLDLEVYEIALAALTAQPVKLPTGYSSAYASPGCDELFMRKSEVMAAIRAAGYEVQE